MDDPLTSLPGANAWSVARNASCPIRRSGWSDSSKFIQRIGDAWVKLNISSPFYPHAIQTIGSASGDSVGSHGGHIPGSSVELSEDDLMATDWTSDTDSPPPAPAPQGQAPVNLVAPVISQKASGVFICGIVRWANAPTSITFDWQKEVGSSWVSTGSNGSSFCFDNTDTTTSWRLVVTATNPYGSTASTSNTLVGV